MADWKTDVRGDSSTDGDDDRLPVLRLGEPVSDGEWVEVEVAAEPEVTDTGENGDALRVEVDFLDAHGDADMSTQDGREFEEGESVVLLSWSSRFMREFADADDRAGGLVGEVVAITKVGEGYDVEYIVDVLDTDS